MKVLFSSLFLLISINLFAAPLESGYALAPKVTASPEEKARAYYEARQKVIEASKKYEGSPYRYGGMTAKGLDCSGFICLSFQDALGVALPRSASGLYSWAERTTFDKAQPGDLLFFKTDKSGNITHVGLYLGERRFIHAASNGDNTGVIYSSLNEKYLANTYAGAGRAFPETQSNLMIDNTSMAGNSGADKKGNKQIDTNKPSASNSGSDETRLLAGIAFAPILNGFVEDGNVLRGFTSQLSFSIDTYSFGQRAVFGFELRPEYDSALGVFRLPITLSVGPDYRIRVFAGPVFSFGDATLVVDGSQRHYSGGTSWFGTMGVTAAPFIIKTGKTEIAPYIEAAWQSYFSDNSDFDIISDFYAGFHLSTGIRWLINFY
ncbi:C40 family peptidase [Treponema sp. R80B11-R83G3]